MEEEDKTSRKCSENRKTGVKFCVKTKGEGNGGNPNCLDMGRHLQYFPVSVETFPKTTD